jgi:hypothetical protein
MDTKTISDLSSWFATITAFIFACIGIFSQPSAFESSRPILPPQEDKAQGSGPEIPGPRLAQSWDDPYAVFEPPSTLPSDGNNPQGFSAPALLIVVLERSSRYQIDFESRLRNRYAIQAALRDAQYIPEGPGELNAVSLTLDPRGGPIHVPIESFRRRVVKVGAEIQESEKQFCFVRIVWLPERLLARSSLESVCSAISKFQSQLASPYTRVSVCVIGPTSSDTLELMCQDESQPGDMQKDYHDSIYPRLLNFQATAAPAMVRLFALQEKDPDAFFGFSRDTIKERINSATKNHPNTDLVTQEGTPIERIGADDFDLCQSLVTEIDRRTRTTGLGKRRILMIAEWDTFYGRAAALAFHLAAARVGRGELLDAALHGRVAERFEIDDLYYMRGLDGSATLYGKKYPADSGSTNPNQAKREFAEGVSQFDYIRRLSEFIGEPLSILLPTLKEPDAIVLLGTDIYDKLTLLKLLRQRFTNSLYATTDLDALYWHPNYVRYTRNLIVAASLPLEVIDVARAATIGKGEASTLDKLVFRRFRKFVFRDSYQTALYCATIFAIGKTPIPDWAKTPKLFEIGNTQAVQLDNSEWTKHTRLDFWGAYFQGVNPWPSLILQTLLVLVAVSYLARLRLLKYQQRSYPAEFYENLKLRLPATFHDLIDRFAEITEEVLIWSSALLPSQQRLNRIIVRIHELNTSIKNIETALGSSEERVQQQLVKSLRELVDHFRAAENGEEKKLTGFLTNPRRILSGVRRLRSLRVKPWWITGIVVPVLCALDQRDENINPEIQRFAKYTRAKAFGKNRFYLALVTAGIFVFAIYCYFSWNFEGIVGAELRDLPTRWYRVIISLLGMGLMVAVVSWTCSEQWKFKVLVEKLIGSVGEQSGLQDRQIVSVVADRSNDVSHLSWKPCVLIFLFYVAHLRVFAGPPFDLFHWIVFVGLLTPVCIVFFLLSTTSLAARRKVVSQYQNEIYFARRLNARIASIVKDDTPIQDDIDSTASLINTFASASSHVFTLSSRGKILPADLRVATTREAIRDYLTTVIARDETILAAVHDLRSDALSPFGVSSILGALLVPLGGAGGLTLLQYIVTQVR